MVTVRLERKNGDYGFVATDANEHKTSFDTAPENGGENFGIRPMQALLMALGSCSAIDVVTILKKQRVVIEEFNIQIQGEREQGEVISLWKKIHVTFQLKTNTSGEKVQKACALSIEKYCSVAETLRRAGAVISWDALA